MKMMSLLLLITVSSWCCAMDKEDGWKPFPKQHPVSPEVPKKGRKLGSDPEKSQLLPSGPRKSSVPFLRLDQVGRIKEQDGFLASSGEKNKKG